MCKLQLIITECLKLVALNKKLKKTKMEYIPESTQKHIDDLVKTINRINKERNKLTSENRALKEQLNLNPSSLHVKEKSTPTFEGFLNSLGKKEWNGEYIYLYDGRFITKQRASEIYKEKYKL